MTENEIITEAKKRTDAVRKCAVDIKKAVNTLLAELTDYVEIQAELWSRGWYEVKEITNLQNTPTIKATMILEDDLTNSKVKKMTYGVEIRMDGAENFTYNVETVSAAEYYHDGGLVYGYREIKGLN